jgi:hypothetical protein
MRIANINDADKEQWKEWQRLSVAERLDHSCTIWADTYELRKNAKKNLRMAIKNCFRGARRK